MNSFIKPFAFSRVILLIGFMLSAPALYASSFLTNYAITVGPIVVGSHLLIGDGAGWVYRIDLHTGKQIWRHHLPASLTEIAVSGNYLAISTYEEGDPAKNR